jgi:choline dehydrogenase-like flavoprotein
MTLFSRREEDVVRAVIDAFRPADSPIPTTAAVDRALRFVNALDEQGSDRVAEIRRILGFLDLALALVDLKDRGAVRRRLTDLEQQAFPFSLLPESRGLARFAQRLAFLCLYASLGNDQRPTAALQTGYRVFEDRGGPPPAIPAEELLPAHLFVPDDQPIPGHEHDVVVIGSGSAGSVLVRRLVEDHGLDVALVEAGDYVPEGRDTNAPHARLRPLVHDEMENLLRYYRHGGLQLTEGVPMFVFQGQCLGGSSVVNNAVCFRAPDRVRDDWAQRFGIGWAASTNAALTQSFDRVAVDLGIRPADEVADALNPSGDFLRRGAAMLSGRPAATALRPCDVNIGHAARCLGCGYCNLTCGYLRKRTVLQAMLLQAAAAAARGQGRLTIYTGRVALGIEGSGSPFRATGVRTAGRRKRNGATGIVRGRKIVVAAGAIGSTGVLERTGEVAALGLPLGDHFSFNFGSPVHADFAAPVHAWKGLQIAHYFDRLDDGFVIETWFNPPATQALALPGWMDAMHGNLARYDHLACAAPLVGSTSRSSVDARGSRGERIHVKLGETDLARLKNGLRTVCEMFAQHTEPPQRLLLGTLDDWQCTPTDVAARIDRITSFQQIQIGTGHPQGGNSLSSNGQGVERKGVVDPAFRVHGTRGLFVVDASVFPTSLGVNPHWTIMAIADLAAPIVAGQ